MTNRRDSEPAAHPPRCSVIIPALNEAEQMDEVVRNALGAGADEVIVADGGSTDETVPRAVLAGARLLEANRGRARQMNAGAAVATGEVLLFLHADTRLPPEAIASLRRALEDPRVVAGAFTYCAAERTFIGRVLSFFGQARHRLSGQPYGDQAMFVRRRVFEELGGFPDLPVMEDWELAHRLRRLGQVVILRERAPSSAASFVEHGFWRSCAVNVAVILAYRWGIDPARLARWRRRIARRPG